MRDPWSASSRTDLAPAAVADDDRLELRAGEVLRVAPHVVRAFRNRGDEDAILIAVPGRRPPEGHDSHPVDDPWTEDEDER